MIRLVDIHRHPVKGFTAESVKSADLIAGQGLPMDRHFAFTSGRREDTPIPGGWVTSRTFLMLTVFPELATFDCKLTEGDATLIITPPEGEPVMATVGKQETFGAASDLLAGHFGDGPFGSPRLVEQAGGHGHWDFSDTAVSIINLATLRVISEAAGRELESERFRGNLYIDGLDPWHEFSWPGCRVRVGEVELDILRPIQRCAMTSTEPGTGRRELDLPKVMLDTFGHHFCGVYARVHSAGRVQQGDALQVSEKGAFNPHDDLPERAALPSLWPRFVARVDEGPDGVSYRPQGENWPLATARAGQAFRTHPLTVGEKPGRHRIASASPQGWRIPHPAPPETLISGPYGSPK